MKQRAAPIRLDSNAATPVHPAAWRAFLRASEAFANPSARHAEGRRAARELDNARAAIASRLGAQPDEIILTSGGTEADALALMGVLIGAQPQASTPHLVVSRIEHAAIARTADLLEQRGAVTVTRLSVDRSGRIDPADVLAACRDSTRLVSVVMASNETGVVQPIRDIVAICRERKILVHTDAVQAVGRLPVDVRHLGVDLLSFSGHKVGAVGGIGVLFARREVPLRGVVVGGGQELGRRSGTENVAGAASLAAALAVDHDNEALARRRDRLEALLAAALDIEVLGRAAPRLPNTSSVVLPCAADGVMMGLDLAGIAVSTGSACSSGSIEPSPILLGMGLSVEEARRVLRFSLDHSVTDGDIEHTAQEVIRLVRACRS